MKICTIAYNDRKDPFEVQEEKEYEIRNYLQAIFKDIQGYSKSRFSMKHFTPEGEIKYKDMDLPKIISDTESYIWVYFDVQEPKEEITQEVIRRLNQINAVPEDLSIQIGDLRKNYASFHRSKNGNLERK